MIFLLLAEAIVNGFNESEDAFQMTINVIIFKFILLIYKAIYYTNRLQIIHIFIPKAGSANSSAFFYYYSS